ncbi:MAG: DNA cytosine methyltransferase [Microbacterium sp.]|uniref:DNA (cytosine-5-)-methyltransferase n=1 Tax=Microbacterium sp. TaxID=51671 RepID=UPI001D1CA60C|nr:DNA (cytosine-5-)-methyltransferase [Microbacterium sp.]MBW8762482.1 DNA cytosine methyltransferase [Microbacterium sp.]
MLSALDRSVVDAVPPGGNWRDLPENFPSQRVQQIRASAGRGEGSRSTYYGRLRWDRPSYTISTYFNRPGNGCFIHPSESRLITVREAARLQTFPDYWRFSGTLRQRAVQIGNAVPPLLGLAVARMFEAGSVVDLFAGAGGLSLGAALAGHSVVAAVDNEPAAVLAHNLNMPGDAAFVADLGDESSARRAWREAAARASGSVDLLIGGPPCQGFSTAGKALKDDPRNKLLWSYVEAADYLRPRALVIENVVALAQSRGRQQLGDVRKALDAMGYQTDVKILHAEGYGVPQRRRRTILVGTRGPLPDWTPPEHSIEPPAFMSSQPDGPQASKAQTVLDAIGDLQIPEGANLDVSVRLGSPRTSLQAWLRGERTQVDAAA